MKMTKKILTVASATLLLSAGSVFAQEFDSTDSFGGDDSGFGDFEEEYTEPAVTWSGEVGASGRAWLRNSKNKNHPGEFGYQKPYDVTKSPMEGNAYVKLNLDYSGAKTDLAAKLKLDTATIKDHPEDVIDEVTARGYFGNWQLEAGKMKSVWGKGDKLHVLDNFNANDYTDFIFPEYIDRRIAEPMLKASYASSYSGDLVSNIKFEGIFTPIMTADRFAESGELVPYSMKNLTETVMGAVKNNLGMGETVKTASGKEYNSVLEMTSFSTDDLYQDNIKSLKYGQAGARFTATLGSVDFGASYYYGHYKQPSANLGAYIDSINKPVTDYVTKGLNDYLKYTETNGSEGSLDFFSKHGAEITKIVTEKYGTAIAKNEISQEDATKLAATEYAKANAQKWVYDGTVKTKLDLPSLNYDQLQVFGLEAAFVLWRFNTRWEVAYNLTEDIAGDDPWVHNNSIGWIAGFDMDIPLHNLNINFQEQGKFILKNNEIKDGTYAEYDVDYNSDDKYISNQFVVNISDKWLHEKLTTECTGIYVLETKELCVQPKISYNVVDGLTFTLSGAYIYSNNENGQFYNFTASDDKKHSKGFAQFGVKYQF